MFDAATSGGVVFHAATGIDANATADVQACVRRRMLRYCARPPFALDRLRELDPEHLVYDPPKPGPGGSGPQLLTPLELLARLAALVPPPRLHRHRYFGVLAPKAPLRAAVTALAPGATTAPPAPNQEPAATVDRKQKDCRLDSAKCNVGCCWKVPENPDHGLRFGG